MGAVKMGFIGFLGNKMLCLSRIKISKFDYTGYRKFFAEKENILDFYE